MGSRLQHWLDHQELSSGVWHDGIPFPENYGQEAKQVMGMFKENKDHQTNYGCPKKKKKSIYQIFDS